MMAGKMELEEDVKEHYRRLAPEYSTRANRTCERAYLKLLKQFLPTGPVLEIGSGSNDFLNQLESSLAVGCDLSVDMLLSSKQRSHCVVAAGETLPFPDAQFDGVFLINVLEHVASVESVLKESARVLKRDGVCLAVTPNGDWEFWLDLAERWNLKIPEGPHSFLTFENLRLRVQKHFEILQHQTFLVFPAGPTSLARFVDTVTFCSVLRNGFFQFVVGQKRA